MLSFTRKSIKFGDTNWNPLIGILTVPSSNLLREVITKKIIFYWFESGLYSPVVETTFKFLTLYKEPSLNMCLNLVTKVFLIVACIRFSYEKKNTYYIKCETIGKKIRENNRRMNFLYNIFINKNHINTNQFSIFFSISRLPHPTKPNPYYPTIFIIVQLMKKRVLHEAHNTKNSNKSNNKNTSSFLKRVLIK